MKKKITVILTVFMIALTLTACKSEYSSIKKDMEVSEVEKVLSENDTFVYDVFMWNGGGVGTIKGNNSWAAIIFIADSKHPYQSFRGYVVDKYKTYKKRAVTDESFHKLKKGMSFFNTVKNVGAAYSTLKIDDRNFMEFKTDSGSSYALCFNEEAKLEKVIRMSDEKNLLEN